jgi:hypothetical protein
MNMEEFYKLIIDFIKIHPEICGMIGLIIFTCLILSVMRLIRRHRKKKQTDKPTDSGNPVSKPTYAGNPVSKPTDAGNPVSKPTDTGNPVSKPKELPYPVIESAVDGTKIIFVNYDINISESIDNYPIIRKPKKGCIIRTYRRGKTKIRDYKEELFQKSIEKYFGNCFNVLGDVRLNTGKDTRPFETDIAIINKGNDKNIRIDIEIDEPYARLTRQPTHCKGDDTMRDTYFVDRGWIVIRFSEYQVYKQEYECLKYIAFILLSIDSSYRFAGEITLPSKITKERLWDTVQAQKWEKEKYRENYLNHKFGELTVQQKTVERGFNEQEIEEEKQVISSIVEKADNGNISEYNRDNQYERDKRITFYPVSHVYTIDNVPAPSVSTVIGKFFPEFDALYWAKRKSNELGMTPDEILSMWQTKGEEAANRGTYLHEQIEKYYLNQQYDNSSKEFLHFQQFARDHSTVNPYRSEWKIFDEDYNIAGTIDLIVKNCNTYEIYDWKRSKKVVNTSNGEPIKNNPFQHGVGELCNIADTSYNHYCLQQSLYRYILEKKYGLKIHKMFLIVLHPDYNRYYKVETPYLKKEILYILKALN